MVKLRGVSMCSRIFMLEFLSTPAGGIVIFCVIGTDCQPGRFRVFVRRRFFLQLVVTL